MFIIEYIIYMDSNLKMNWPLS